MGRAAVAEIGRLCCVRQPNADLPPEPSFLVRFLLTSGAAAVRGFFSHQKRSITPKEQQWTH
jgi:hypothetical protein